MPCLIKVGDRSLELRFTLKALKALDAEHNLSVFRGEGLGEALREPGKLAVVLYYGLRTRQPDITQDWVEENFDASMLLDLAPVLAYATTGRWPDMDKILANLPNAARPADSTGSPSGPLADTTSRSVN